MKKLVLVVAAVFVITGLAAPVQATPITGASSGTFTAWTCTSGCGGLNTAEIWWGDGSYANGSRLAIIPVNFSSTGYGTPFVIADLKWRNSVDTSGTWNPNPFATTATINFNFTDPVSATNHAFVLSSIYETPNPENDETLLPSLAGLSFNLGNGYVIDTFTYNVIGAGSLSGLTWTGNECIGNCTAGYLESDLQIKAVAHYTPPSVPDGGATLVLLGGALIGLGALRRKFRV